MKLILSSNQKIKLAQKNKHTHTNTINWIWARIIILRYTLISKKNQMHDTLCAIIIFKINL